MKHHKKDTLWAASTNEHCIYIRQFTIWTASTTEVTVFHVNYGNVNTMTNEEFITTTSHELNKIGIVPVVYLHDGNGFITTKCLNCLPFLHFCCMIIDHFQRIDIYQREQSDKRMQPLLIGELFTRYIELEPQEDVHFYSTKKYLMRKIKRDFSLRLNNHAKIQSQRKVISIIK